MRPDDRVDVAVALAPRVALEATATSAAVSRHLVRVGDVAAPPALEGLVTPAVTGASAPARVAVTQGVEARVALGMAVQG